MQFGSVLRVHPCNRFDGFPLRDDLVDIGNEAFGIEGFGLCPPVTDGGGVEAVAQACAGKGKVTVASAGHPMRALALRVLTDNIEL